MTAPDPLDVSLHDTELYEEVQLVTRVIIAASESGEGGPALTMQEIDELLGLRRRRH